jgi:hypothetical protein
METVRDTVDGRVMIRPVQRPAGLADSDSRPPMEASWDYLAVEMDTGGKLIPITVEYDKSVSGNNFTHTMNVEPPQEENGGTVKLFFPVYEVSAIPPPEGRLTIYTGTIPWRRGRFLGVSLDEKDASCVKAISRVAVTDTMSLLPWLWLPQNPAAVRRHNTTPLEGRLDALWANAASHTGNADDALARYRQLLCWHPAEPRLYDGIDALVRRASARWDPVVLWGRLADVHADQPYVCSKLAVALTSAGRFAEARGILQAVTDKVGLRPYLCDAYLGTMLKSGDLKGAKSYMQWCRENNCPVSRAAARAADDMLRSAEKNAP